MVTVCVSCGEEFSARIERKYCSRKCYLSRSIQRKPLAERFRPFVEKGEGCWLWLGSNDGRVGYGRFHNGAGPIGAHRASWIISFGDIPDGLHVCHKCDNPACVRPDHLFLGTREVNQADSVNKGRNRSPDNRGSKCGTSKLTADEVLAIRSEYVFRKVGMPKLATKYGVAMSTIQSILERRNWKHI